MVLSDMKIPELVDIINSRYRTDIHGFAAKFMTWCIMHVDEPIVEVRSGQIFWLPGSQRFVKLDYVTPHDMAYNYPGYNVVLARGMCTFYLYMS